MKPAPCCLQYSSTLTVPTRLCSMSWRLLLCPSTPASTLGLAAASITQSAGGSASKSLARARRRAGRSMPSRCRRARFVSLPGPAEVVDAGDCETLDPRRASAARQRAADEAANAGDEDLHYALSSAAARLRRSPRRCPVSDLVMSQCRVVGLHLAQVAVVADVVADAVLVHVAPLHRLAGDCLRHAKASRIEQEFACRRPGCRPRRRAAPCRTRT